MTPFTIISCYFASADLFGFAAHTNEKKKEEAHTSTYMHTALHGTRPTTRRCVFALVDTTREGASNALSKKYQVAALWRALERICECEDSEIFLFVAPPVCVTTFRTIQTMAETGGQKDDRVRPENPIPLVFPYVQKHAEKGNPASVLSAMDEFGWNECWMMFIGERKGAYLDKTVSELGENARVLELG